MTFRKPYIYRCRCSQGARHSYAEAVGKNVANPTALLLCAAKMLTHINLQYYGDMIRNAVNTVLKTGKVSRISHSIKLIYLLFR